MTLSEYQTIRVATADLNGQLRGKRLPSSQADKLANGGLRMPLSALNVDIWGDDINNSPLVFESGDADGILRPTNRDPVPMPWLETPSKLHLMSMFHEDGTPFLGDPRQALNHVLERFSTRGWSVLAATEMEFTLVDDSAAVLRAPIDPRTGRRLFAGDILSVDALDAFDPFFTELHAGACAMGIDIQSMIGECGLGQFEVTLNHRDARRAADDAILFKHLARGIARKHGMAATFVAKPYIDDAGNGMHVHFSVLDQNGTNVFDNGGAEGSDILHYAIAGCLAAMPASTLILAPHGPSYDRFARGSHAPTSACWAYENRTAAIRVPGGAPTARRIEHRTAGGDTNPYLVFATILGAAMAGIEDERPAAAPITGNAYDLDLPQLAPDWATAVELFATDPLIARILPNPLIRNLTMTKRQELKRLVDIPEQEQWQTYLERV
ncbi:glutamine synthetase family protein [Shimia abyssi]|uniref:Glutamate--putrescine ligase n=1 Tax=Shimia abyssi TaxID=1662395 RepID=A0A2P8FJ96_9RHOB|nr:glutamine synthetase family protein [Shimia abyssi]PSL21773.1 glutamate--putrescine ligase [Shimia abyssi]